MFKATRRAHRWFIGLTGFLWLVIGPLIGTIGYCPITALQGRVKQARGIQNFPNSYIDYLLQKVGVHIQPAAIDFYTGTAFAITALATICVWWKDRKKAA